MNVEVILLIAWEPCSIHPLARQVIINESVLNHNGKSHLNGNIDQNMVKRYALKSIILASG
jgi:hypothetical protein